MLLPVSAALALLFAAALVHAGEQQAVGLDARIAEIAAKIASLPNDKKHVGFHL